ncbi:MAG: hypothetical protein GKS05_12675 [Nitrospirales bacterium]|nr:hypothetical protein [Nitrospirales bacterium]
MGFPYSLRRILLSVMILASASLACLLVWGVASGKEIIVQTEEFFPDHIGNTWRYKGHMIEGMVSQIANTSFVNVSTVKREEIVDGVDLLVFHDTNPGNQGPSDSYYRRDVAGIQYYGSKPGTVLERQLVPYQVLRFPIEIQSTFQQLDRQHLDLGLDLDRDGKNEQVDVRVAVTVLTRESVTVPFGQFPHAIRMEARMNMVIHLSGTGNTVNGSDTMTTWFAKGVGLVKYIERQRIPMVGSEKKRTIEVIEELEEAMITSDTASLQGSKPTT